MASSSSSPHHPPSPSIPLSPHNPPSTSSAPSTSAPTSTSSPPTPSTLLPKNKYDEYLLRLQDQLMKDLAVPPLNWNPKECTLKQFLDWHSLNDDIRDNYGLIHVRLPEDKRVKMKELAKQFLDNQDHDIEAYTVKIEKKKCRPPPKSKKEPDVTPCDASCKVDRTGFTQFSYKQTTMKKHAVFKDANFNTPEFNLEEKVYIALHQIIFLRSKSSSNKGQVNMNLISTHKVSDNVKNYVKDNLLKTNFHYCIESDDNFANDDTLFGEPMKSATSLLKDIISPLKSKNLGILTPYRYVGTPGSCFPFHVEDLGHVNSCNCNCAGHPKLWLGIPPKYYNKLVKCYNKHIGLKGKKRHFTICDLLHKETFLDPFLLYEWEIPFCFKLQEEGDIICTMERTFHEGFNLGYNHATSINIILLDFIKYWETDDGRMECHCTYRKKQKIKYVVPNKYTCSIFSMHKKTLEQVTSAFMFGFRNNEKQNLAKPDERALLPEDIEDNEEFLGPRSESEEFIFDPDNETTNCIGPAKPSSSNLGNASQSQFDRTSPLPSSSEFSDMALETESQIETDIAHRIPKIEAGDVMYKDKNSRMAARKHAKEGLDFFKLKTGKIICGQCNQSLHNMYTYEGHTCLTVFKCVPCKAVFKTIQGLAGHNSKTHKSQQTHKRKESATFPSISPTKLRKK